MPLLVDGRPLKLPLEEAREIDVLWRNIFGDLRLAEMLSDPAQRRNVIASITAVPGAGQPHPDYRPS